MMKRNMNEKNSPTAPHVAKASQGSKSAVNLKRTPILITSPITIPIPYIDAPFPIASLEI